MNFKILKTIAFGTCIGVGVGACSQKAEHKDTPPKDKSEMTINLNDPHSFAKPNEAVVKHLDWDADINFEEQTISAIATLHIDTNDEANELILDTKALAIKKVTLDAGTEEATYEIAAPVEHLGSALKIKIKPTTSKVNITYTTTPGAEALQWLAPAQTAGKKHPFLFTQSQAILARSWVPIQDSPGIRFTYNAKVKVPEGLLALMSAENPEEKSTDGTYHFKMEQPIPAYLLALSVGDVAFKSIGPRTGVYAEPSMLDKAAYEFGELEDMVKAAEELYGPYQWERYDIIVLPPSFPFGGMENPRLTFATPTILAGDRSLTSLVAHELAHSWSGNLVTNATWNDFWLNEGFTVYFEQRIMEALYGRDYSEMLAALSAQDLKEEIKGFEKSGMIDDTRLKLNLEKRSPDDGVTTIAYDKGYLFLRMLEEKVGRQHFDRFLRNYFEKNAFKVMDTETFIEYLKNNLFELNGVPFDKTMVDSWIYGEGLPANSPEPVSDRFDKVAGALNNWLSGESELTALNTKTWSSHEWQHFVRLLPESLSTDKMMELDKTFGFTNTGNSEVLTAWLVHVIANRYEAGYIRLEEFLINTGRRKFLSPLYDEMTKTEEGLAMAKQIYQKARPNYHFVATNTFDKKLKQ